MSAQTTRTPWRVVKRGGLTGAYFRVVDDHSMAIARTYGDSLGDEEDAALIVRAVNAHYALVTALRDLLEASDAPEFPAEQWRFEQARAALSLASGAP